ncbi:histidine kinase [Actinoplanes sp. SE50]|uniref:PAS domain-containing sensor histidine kinase n=1 Tax=unclassified Actinoplanes TaxID=2626549 RepID=UPI00023ED061|nr:MULTISPECIES: ATP-binding protein [unclassified Actinoplanes]AEV84363.1 Phytochrome B [Actinoplanes sp. SE50/110]ATO82755.1 histidine kinase [Actinoplanes sp. SE50]SLM00162.1 signal transduction histidine kinase [Actinoplanes sp. SE50/110]
MAEPVNEVSWEALFRAVPTPLLVLDTDLMIVEANQAYLTATMRSRTELVGRPVFEAFPDNPEDAAASGVTMWGASLQRVLSQCTTDVMAIQRYDIPRPWGGFDTRYWAPANAPVFGPDGELRWIIHRTEDVTAFMQARHNDPAALAELTEQLRIRTEQMATEVFARRELEEQNESLHALLDSLDTAVVGCDAEGRTVLRNEAARQLFGALLDQVPVQRWAEYQHVFHPDGHRMSGDDIPLMRALRGERVRDAEIVVRVPEAPRRYFRANGRPVAGHPRLAAVVALHEITLHRRAARFKECELELSRLTSKPAPPDEIFAEMVQLISRMAGWAAVEFWTVDDVARVLYRTTCWAEPGYDLPCRLPDPLSYGQGVPGRAWQTSDPIWAANLPTDPDAAQQATDWGPLRAALAIPIPSGSVILGVLVCYSDVPETPDDTRTAMMTGIGAHIGEFLSRRRAERLTEELDRSRDEYIALVGHELRTPLTSLQAYTDVMIDEPDLSVDERQSMLKVMQRNTASLRAIVTKLLDVAGMRSGHVDLHRQPMDLATIVHEAADDARTGAQITIEVNTPPQAPLHGDPARLRQVVDELLSNALTWAPRGSAIGINLRADPRAIAVSVSNTGRPLTVEERGRLFDTFFRGESARNGGVPGTGLGLTIARTIVEEHGGTIAVSEPDEAATTFTIRLPTHQPAPNDSLTA